MKSPDQDFDDVLFQDRNKAYGAYQLRKAYPRYITQSLLIAVLGYILAVGTPWAIKKWKDAHRAETEQPARKVRVIQYSELSPPPPIERKRPTPPEPVEKVKTLKYVEPVVKPDEEVPEEEEYVPTQDELMESQAGAETVEGEDSVDVEQYFDAVEADPEPEPAPPPPPPKVFEFVEQMPSFPGGDVAFLHFLNANIRYPDAARDFNVEGKVVLQFVVDAAGCVVDPVVVKGIGMGCDKEAVRVLRESPIWEPGVQGGYQVPVKLYVTVEFKLTN